MTEVFTLQSILAFLACYIIGSFPTAYILVKAKSNKDITKEGSGNVGTLNSFQVSKSKRVGAAVLLIDIIKGGLPIYIMLFVLHIPFAAIMVGALGLIVGHNYPIWLRFKGGRGLATGTGIFIVLNYFILAGWCIIWAIVFFLIKKNVLIANTAATAGIILLVALVNIFPWMQVNTSVLGYSTVYFTVFSIIITIVILIRHTDVLKEFSPNHDKSIKS